MTEPMSDERLAEIEAVPLLADVPDLIAEVRRLRAELHDCEASNCLSSADCRRARRLSPA